MGYGPREGIMTLAHSKGRRKVAVLTVSGRHYRNQHRTMVSRWQKHRGGGQGTRGCCRPPFSNSSIQTHEEIQKRVAVRGKSLPHHWPHTENKVETEKTKQM
jgi:hypothetical protein